MIDKDILLKYKRTPSECTTEELKQVDAFLTEYKRYRDSYREAFITDPKELSIETMLFNIKLRLSYENIDGGLSTYM